jgi:hypothetical protein
MTVTREAFKMLKVKLLENGGVKLKSRIDFNGGTSVNHESGEKEITTEPHEDLSNPIKGMKKFLLQIFPFKSGAEDRVKATGVAISGMDENRGAIITGTYETPSGRVVAINSDRIPLGASTYGFEEELAGMVDVIEDECFLYAHEGKCSQMEIAFPE